ncbi:MAG: apolipoprotein N-acyltransferase [Aquificae bacterium]|nr:apolipoprotein N-acyltransferase [Aquificota bacterium]
MSYYRLKEALLGVTAGLLFWLAFSKWGLFFLLPPAFLLALRGSLLRFTLFGFTGLLLSLRWVVMPSLLGGVKPVFAYAGLVLLVAFLTLYQFLLPYLLWVKLKRRPELFPFLYALAELARSFFPYGGFPWLLVGAPFVELELLAPLYRYYTVYGVGLLVLWLTLTPLLKRKALLALPFLAVLALPQPEVRLGVKVALVQPAVPQEVKLDLYAFVRTYPELVRLVRRAVEARPDAVFLPETALPFYLEELPERAGELLELSKKAPIVLGVIDYSGRAPKNAVVLLKDGKVAAVYHKTLLVPFGEYTPFPFRYLAPLVPYFALTDYAPGDGPKCLKLGRFTVGTPVCFEVAYAHYVRSFSCDFLAVLTNDAWFLDSDGTYQHFTLARVRAAELSRFVLWVNNLGPSAVIGPRGEVIALLPYARKGVLLSSF